MAKPYSVSYWVPDERYWQFSGEWESISQAERQAEYLLNCPEIYEVRMRQGKKIVRRWRG